MNYGECEVREDFVCVSFMFLYFLMKNTIGILIGSALDMYIALGNMYRCNILGAVHLFLEME